MDNLVLYLFIFLLLVSWLWAVFITAKSNGALWAILCLLVPIAIFGAVFSSWDSFKKYKLPLGIFSLAFILAGFNPAAFG